MAKEQLTPMAKKVLAQIELDIIDFALGKQLEKDEECDEEHNNQLKYTINLFVETTMKVFKEELTK